MTMPPLADDREDSRRWFAALARARRRDTACASCRWARRRTSPSPSQEGATIVRIGTTAVRADCRTFARRVLAYTLTPWPFRDTWHRALVYFGLAEERDPTPTTRTTTASPSAELEDRYRERPNVRRLSTRRRRDDFDDIFADDEPPARAQPAPGRRRRGARPRRATAATSACTSSSPSRSTTPSRSPTSSRTTIPVVLNLQGDRHRPLQAADRLRLRPHLRARRRHAADRRQGLHAHAAQRRDLAPRSARS